MNETSPSPLADLDTVAIVFEALAHADRRQILLVLHARGESMTSKEVAERFSTTWATVSRHLKTLQKAGLIDLIDSDDRRERHYRLHTDRLREVAGKWIERFDANPNHIEERNHGDLLENA